MRSLRPEYDAIVLAGGRASRLGGVSKPDVVVAGRRLLAHALRATAAAERTVVVGPTELLPDRPPPTLLSTRERPAYGGPAAGIAAGLDALDRAGEAADVVLVLACDAPRAHLAVPALLDAVAADPDADGARLVDADGRAQPLVAAYRRRPLRAALARLEGDTGVHGASMRELTGGLRLGSVPDPGAHGADVDTWADVRRLEQLMARDDADQTEADELARWVSALAAELGVDPAVVDIPGVLALAGDAAHAVVRPAAPLTTFLVGYAAGRVTAQAPSAREAAARASALAERWAGGERSGG